jgi:hypothetical protein
VNAVQEASSAATVRLAGQVVGVVQALLQGRGAQHTRIRVQQWPSDLCSIGMWANCTTHASRGAHNTVDCGM